MTSRTLLPLALAGSLLSSCIYYTNPVPEMPYRAYKPNSAQEQANAHANNAAYLNAPVPPGAWDATAATQPNAPYAPLPSTQPTVPATVPVATTPLPVLKPPTPTPATTSTAITQAPLKLNPPVATTQATTPAALPVLKPASTPAPAKAASTVANPKLITNDGPIPVATPVPGDPTRVYNPLDPSKTIRIISNKATGTVYPSGKKLKVPGTSYFFYVP